MTTVRSSCASASAARTHTHTRTNRKTISSKKKKKKAHTLESIGVRDHGAERLRKRLGRAHHPPARFLVADTRVPFAFLFVWTIKSEIVRGMLDTERER